MPITITRVPHSLRDRKRLIKVTRKGKYSISCRNQGKPLPRKLALCTWREGEPLSLSAVGFADSKRLQGEKKKKERIKERIGMSKA